MGILDKDNCIHRWQIRVNDPTNEMTKMMMAMKGFTNRSEYIKSLVSSDFMVNRTKLAKFYPKKLIKTLLGFFIG